MQAREDCYSFSTHLFYGLAVKTGSIALQKCFFFVFFSFFFGPKKFVIWGQIGFFPDSFQKTNGTPWPSFFDILASFGVKKVCALFS